MEIEVVKDTKLELEMIIHGENHSLCNVLRKYLMEDSDVEYAVYGIDHPLTGEPIMTIKTKRTKRPRDSLLRAAQRLKEETAEFFSFNYLFLLFFYHFLNFILCLF